MKILVVTDMQNDFITGSLGTAEAQAILPRVRQKISDARAAGDKLIFTRDTHNEDYLSTREGKRLPVTHCIKGTDGWQIADGLADDDDTIIDKYSFGSTDIASAISALNPESVEFFGVCTDICVLSNVMVLKAQMPELDIYVDASCCAGATPQGHANALAAMKVCQIDVVNE